MIKSNLTLTRHSQPRRFLVSSTIHSPKLHDSFDHLHRSRLCVINQLIVTLARHALFFKVYSHEPLHISLVTHYLYKRHPTVQAALHTHFADDFLSVQAAPHTHFAGDFLSVQAAPHTHFAGDFLSVQAAPHTHFADDFLSVQAAPHAPQDSTSRLSWAALACNLFSRPSLAKQVPHSMEYHASLQDHLNLGSATAAMTSTLSKNLQVLVSWCLDQV